MGDDKRTTWYPKHESGVPESGVACWNCGTSFYDCLVKLHAQRLGACCDQCFLTDTHDALVEDGDTDTGVVRFAASIPGQPDGVDTVVDSDGYVWQRVGNSPLPDVWESRRKRRDRLC